jgi:hypothetical protein
MALAVELRMAVALIKKKKKEWPLPVGEKERTTSQGARAFFWVSWCPRNLNTESGFLEFFKLF